MIPVLPCPFCGGDASIVYHFNEWWGLCGNKLCSASGAGKNTKREAKKAWNTRLSALVPSNPIDQRAGLPGSA